jgi:hypothetical protein
MPKVYVREKEQSMSVQLIREQSFRDVIYGFDVELEEKL